MPSAPRPRCPAIPRGTGAHGKQKVSMGLGQNCGMGEVGPEQKETIEQVGTSGEGWLVVPESSKKKTRGRVDALHS